MVGPLVVPLMTQSASDEKSAFAMISAFSPNCTCAVGHRMSPPYKTARHAAGADSQCAPRVRASHADGHNSGLLNIVGQRSELNLLDIGNAGAADQETPKSQRWCKPT